VDRRVLIALAVAVIAVSTIGRRLTDANLLGRVLFAADTLLGMVLLTFALAVEPTDRDP
jgi:hypothetical protein